MIHRFETNEGDISLIVSENQIKVIRKNAVNSVSIPPLSSRKDFFPAGGEIEFEDGRKLTYLPVGNEIFVHLSGETWSFKRKERELALATQNSPEIKSPMPGKIIQMLAEVGKKFKAGETILILEAMKMENAIKAPFDCKVNEILKKAGEIVQQDEPMVILDKIESEKT